MVGAKTACVYPSHHISLLHVFDAIVGRDINCVMVFNDAAPGWSGWEHPWILGTTSADMNWRAWATASGTHRRLVLTQNLFPASEDSANWLQQGASGAYESYARTLATNLVNAGLGSSIIRLAHEANGTWYPDSIPNTPAGDAQWVQFWRNTVLAMRSVPGARFQFDWCVNATYRNVPLSSFYPGDDVVDIIGVDAYDGSSASRNNRWPTIYGRSMGVQAVQAFAAAHGKPMSVPEWGLVPSINPRVGGGGDDPGYVSGLASVIQSSNVAYQSYFFSGDQYMQLMNSPNSITALRAAYGPNGYAVSSGDRGPQTLLRLDAPSLTISGGPAFASTVSSNSVTFSFTAASGYTPVCSLDSQPWRACSSGTTDLLPNLAPGYHRWSVQVTDALGAVTLRATDFVVS